jgi:hypothetical protein
MGCCGPPCRTPQRVGSCWCSPSKAGCPADCLWC